MGNVVADSRLSLQGPSDEPDLRVALVHETGVNTGGDAGAIRSPAALAAILAGEGLPPNAGVLPLRRAGALAGHPPEVIVLAADLARPAGLATVRYLRREVPTARIVVMARDVMGGLARQALNAGAEAFVSEHDAPETLGAAVRAVVAGLVCAPRMTRRLVAKPTFTHREKEILELLVGGMTNREIADRLYLAESTVKSHVTSAFAKLGVRSRKDAAAILLDPAEGLAPAALPSDVALPRGRAASGVTSRRRASAQAEAPHRERASGR
jgi:DNA-binding NarL/FixJ family response regulator